MDVDVSVANRSDEEPGPEFTQRQSVENVSVSQPSESVATGHENFADVNENSMFQASRGAL